MRKEESAPQEAAPVPDRRKKTAVVEKAKEPAPQVVAPVPESRKTSALLERAKQTSAPKTTTPESGGKAVSRVAPPKATTTPESGGKAVSRVPESGGQKAESALKAEKNSLRCGTESASRGTDEKNEPKNFYLTWR